MIDPDFDPLEQLNDCKIEIMRMAETLNQLIVAHNNRERIINKIIDQQRIIVKNQKKINQDLLEMSLAQAWQEFKDERDE